MGARVSRSRVVLTIDTPTDAAITVEQYDVRRRIAHSAEQVMKAGRRRVKLTPSLGAEPLNTYTLSAVARTPSGTAADQVTLALGPTLARDLVDGILYDALNSDVLSLGPCARMARRRVDCAIVASHQRCVRAIAVTRRPDGLLERTYRCRAPHGRPFSLHPHYTTPETLLPSSDYY